MKKPIFACLLFFTSLAAAGADSIHPLCFEPFADLSAENPRKSIDLSDCQKQHADLSFTLKKPWQGSFEATEAVSIETPDFAQYEIIGQLQDQKVLVDYRANYGGTGVFSYGFLVEGLSLSEAPNQKQLTHTLTLGSGDRCSGGIEEMAVIAPNKVSITQSITPAPLVNLGRDKPQTDIEAGLPYCAICCVGSYTRHVDLQGKSELVEVKVNTKSLATFESPQAKCLNRLINADNRTVNLTRKALEELQTSYIQQCVSKKLPRT